MIDNNGNTTLSGTVTNFYDFENRMTQHGTNPGLLLAYDGDGNRVSETIGGATTKFLVDDHNPTGLPQVLDELLSGAVTRTYAYGLQRLNENQQISGTWTPSFYGYDGHGNVRFLTNVSGVVTDSYDYDAFGMPIRTSGTTPNQFLYSSERYDGGIGLYDLRARYYNHATGHFWARDPVWGKFCCGLSWNPYIYVTQNPVNAIDPTGRTAIEEVDIDNASITFSNHGLAHLIEAGAGDSQAAVEAYIDALVRQYIAQVQAAGGWGGNTFVLLFNSPLLQGVGWGARVFIVSAAEIAISTYFPQLP